MAAPRLPRRVDRESLNIVAHNLLRRVAWRAGLDLVRADFNSPIVDTRALAHEIWERQAPLYGVELDLDAELELIEAQLQPFVAEFQPPLHEPQRPLGFFLENRWYGPMDAHILYAMLRHAAPRRVLELGSGYSTLVIAAALAANSAAGNVCRHELVDPYPSRLLAGLGGRVNVQTRSAATIEPAIFEGLGSGDVLFVDTTHVIRPGGEVVRLVLEVLPTLAPGVIVHFHDIFRPFEYPRMLYDRFNVHWQEQYLVQAFLAYNPNFAVLCANHALWRLRRRRIEQLFPGLREGMAPSALWLVRAGPQLDGG